VGPDGRGCLADQRATAGNRRFYQLTLAGQPADLVFVAAEGEAFVERSGDLPVAEIASPANDFNLNIPRYVDSSEPEDLQDLDVPLIANNT
jgi:hypothetical protein